MKLNGSPAAEKIGVFCAYAIITWGFLFLTGTIFSGFHLSDDQILITFNNRLQHEPFLSAAYHEIADDLFIRFRPLAIFYYMLLSKWPYPDFTMIAWLVSLQAILTCYFFYRFARYLKCNAVLSFLFPLFILCGNQGVVFWRNCVNETFAMLLLSISFFYLGKLLSNKSHHPGNTFAFGLFLLLSTLTKESFIILVPAILFLKVWQESNVYGKTFPDSVKQNIKLIIVFTVIVIAELAVIFYYKAISPRFINYIGVDESTFTVSNLHISLVRLWITKGYLLVILPFVLFILFMKRKAGNRKEFWTFFLPLTLLFLLITIPQILLYSKSLIFERYLLPGTVGSALVILFLHQYVKRYQPLQFLNKFFLPACTLLLCLQIVLMTRGAAAYANTGYSVKKMLNSIMEHTDTQDTILLVAYPLGQSDQALSTKTYLNAEIGGKRRNVFIEPLIDSAQREGEVESSVIENFILETKGISYQNISKPKNIRCITFFEKTLPTFMKNHTDFDTTQFRKVSDGQFLIYVKK